MESFSPSLEHLVLEYFKKSVGKSAGKRDLMRALDIRTAPQRTELRAVLRELERKGLVFRLRGGRWTAPSGTRHVGGILRVHPHRFGFVTPDAPSGEDIYIPEEELSVALDGDRVLVEIMGRGIRHRPGHTSHSVAALPRGRIIRVLERRRTRIVGRLCRTQWYEYVIPDSPRIPHSIRIRSGSPVKALESHKVWVQLDEWTRNSEPLTGVVVEDLGPADQVGVDVISIMREHGIEADFPEEVSAEAAMQVAGYDIQDALTGREDLRNVLTFTIDPAEAKDFDDAVSVDVLSSGHIKLGVHIADVPYFVRPGTALDREAFLRGNSVYLVDRAIPMLPPALSSGLCSLQPGQDRLTHTVEMEFDTHGRLQTHRTFPSIICSSARLTYEQVQAFFDGGGNPGIPDPVQHALRAMRELASELRKRRMSQGSLDLWMPEIRCVLDETGCPVALVKRGADEAYNLIEEFMLAANRVVALRLAAAEAPALYRIHPPPDKFQWEWMQEELKALDIPLGSRTRDALNEIARASARSDMAHIVHLAILRNLKRACYSAQRAEHFGLAFTHYTHFTSPIRRYPDLVVHRILQAVEKGLPSPLTPDETVRIAEHCSWTERNADEAEQESLDIKRIEYFARLLQNGDTGPFDGIVVNVTPRGPVIELTETFQRGLLPFRSLDHDYYYLNDSRTAAHGQRTRRTWRIGQRIRVVVARVDRFRRQVDFALDKGEISPAHSRSAKGGSRKKGRSRTV